MKKLTKIMAIVIVIMISIIVASFVRVNTLKKTTTTVPTVVTEVPIIDPIIPAFQTQVQPVSQSTVEHLKTAQEIFDEEVQSYLDNGYQMISTSLGSLLTIKAGQVVKDVMLVLNEEEDDDLFDRAIVLYLVSVERGNFKNFRVKVNDMSKPLNTYYSTYEKGWLIPWSVNSPWMTAKVPSYMSLLNVSGRNVDTVKVILDVPSDG